MTYNPNNDNHDPQDRDPLEETENKTEDPLYSNTSDTKPEEETTPSTPSEDVAETSDRPETEASDTTRPMTATVESANGEEAEKNSAGPKDEDARPRFEHIQGAEQEAKGQGSHQYDFWREKEREVQVRKLVREEIRRNYKPKRRWLSQIALVLVGAILGGVFGAFVTGTQIENKQGLSAIPSSVKIDLSDEKNIESIIAHNSIPSIVGITTLVQRQTHPFFSNGIIYGEDVGSGVIIDSNGYILTNSHVVNNGNSKEIKVKFADESEIPGQVLWSDETLDLAIVKVDKKGLPAIPIGDSDKISVGDKAIAIGNPLGLELQSTLTSGYISGMNRTIQLENGLIMDGLLQTDAAINSGNSGGALLNAKGELIGINTAKPQGSEGIGFAIPINTAVPILEKIIKTGSFEPVYIGISGMNLQTYRAMRPSEKWSIDSGIYVAQVYANSAAGQAGIQPGDVIVKIGDTPVDSMNGLKKVLLNFKNGDETTITYVRGKKEITKSIRFTDVDLPEVKEQPKQEEPNEPLFPFFNEP